MAKPPPSPPRAYPEQAPGGWTVDKVRSALALLEAGQTIEPASRLTRACGRSPVYCQARDQRIDTVLGLPLEVLPAGRAWEGKGLARQVADAGRTMLGALLSGGCERWLLELGRMMNLAIGVLGWDTTGERWDPVTLERWPLSAVRLDPWARRMWARVMPSAEHPAGEMEIVPGDGTWVVFAPGGLWNWDAAMVRTIAEAWITRGMGVRDLANRAAADAVAGLDLPLPASVEPTSTEATDYMTAAKGLQQGAGGLLRPAIYPEPRILDLASKSGGASMKSSLDRAEKDLIVSWLGQDATSTNEGGSLAKTIVLNGVLYDKIEADVRELYGQLGAGGEHEPGCVTEQILGPWARLNWGRDDVRPLARRVVPDLEEGDRLAQDAARAQVFRLEVKELQGSFVLTPEAVRELARVRGVRMPDAIVWEARTAPPPIPPAPPTK